MNGRDGSCKPNGERARDATTRVLYRQALASLCATTSKHLPPRTGGHARTESMSTLTMNFARLIGALHAETRRENCAKTSTWWAEKKAGKGTQRTSECQARTAHES